MKMLPRPLVPLATGSVELSPVLQPESCTDLSYESHRELADQKYLSHLPDTVLDEYAEEAE
jgi:hypothetical protein